MDKLYPIPVLNNKQRCPFVSMHLDCHAGGFATAECFHPSFHEECAYKKRAQTKYEKIEHADAEKKAETHKKEEPREWFS